MTYMTQQQRAVLKCIEQCKGNINAVELLELLHQQGYSIGLTTVYRQLERLEQQGMLHKIVTDDGASYQYCDSSPAHDCFLLKCEKCGRIEHLDCSHLGELYEHLLAEHHFVINPRKTLFYGLCEVCSQEAQK